MTNTTEQIIKNWEIAKTRVFPKLVNRKNASTLNTPVPDTDLAYEYYIQIAVSPDSSSLEIVAVTSEILSHWNISKEELDSCTMDNLSGMPRVFTPLERWLDKTMTGEKLSTVTALAADLWILTNTICIIGAGLILNPEIMESCRCTAFPDSNDIYILPVSINEVILTANLRNEPVEKYEQLLKQLVLKAGKEPEGNEKYLSNCVYVWNKDTGKLHSV